jgi:hypothetical protein
LTNWSGLRWRVPTYLISSSNDSTIFELWVRVLFNLFLISTSPLMTTLILLLYVQQCLSCVHFQHFNLLGDTTQSGIFLYVLQWLHCKLVSIWLTSKNFSHLLDLLLVMMSFFIPSFHVFCHMSQSHVTVTSHDWSNHVYRLSPDSVQTCHDDLCTMRENVFIWASLCILYITTYVSLKYIRTL